MSHMYNKNLLIIFIITLVSCKISFAQNQKPIAMRDTASTLAEVPVTVNVLLNDYDPENDSVCLYGHTSPRHGNILKTSDDSSFKYTSNYYTGMDSVWYTIKDVNGNVSEKAYLVINVLNNPVLPYANNDSGSTISCDSLLINLTKNDTDPNNDLLTIGNLRANHAQVLKALNDSVVLYRSKPSFTGTDTISYCARKKNNYSLYSNTAMAVITVGPNPEVPVAVNDTIDYICYTRKHFYPLQNDTIPTQEPFEVRLAEYWKPPLVIKDDQSAEYHDSVTNWTATGRYYYHIRKKYDTVFTSNTALIVIRCSVNPQFFYAVNDTFSVPAYGYAVQDLVANDHNPNPSDSLKILYVSYGHLSDSVRYNERSVIYYAGNKFSGLDSLHYILQNKSDPVKRSIGKIYVEVINKNAAYLDINNVRARFTASGLHFFKEDAEYEVPKGSGKTSLFANSLWIGGKDGLDSLHFAGEKYRQGGPMVSNAWTWPDYYAGPVMDSSAYGRKQDSTWNYIWKLKRTDIEYHRNHYTDAGYQPIQDILTWPGNGNANVGQAEKLAPYVDQNKDGVYNPFDGDYPALRGDQSLFFIFNDDRDLHHDSRGEKLKVEIHGLAYAFDRPEDTAFKNTVFLHYTVINRSPETYTDSYLGVFTDIDLGYSRDDFIECDVERNMYYGYNGDSVDGTGQTNSYGPHPPMQGVIILQGPKMDDDGIDNPKFDNLGNQLCDESVNGMFFGDSIVDNERFGMRRFIYFSNLYNSSQYYISDPYFAPEYYNLMKGIWKDGTPMQYGGNGHFSSGAYGPACDFIFPGNTDSLNWGVGCEPPNGPKNWTEITAGNIPDDRRGVSSSGPFTFKPGDRQDIDIAFAWARDYKSTDPQGSLIKLQNVADKINKAFAENKLPDGTPIYGIHEEPGRNNIEFKVYPNPANDFITIEFERKEHENTSIKIISLRGEVIKEESFQGQRTGHIKVSDLSNGVYVIQCQSKNSIGTKKFILMR